jgi:uncharacterized protein involved in oxidation of intracellular sulfur
MKVLVIVNGSAYGSDATFNAIRLAGSLGKRDGVQLQLFLMGDGVTCTVAGQKVPDGYYHLDRMLTSVLRHDGEVACCGTCLDARGLTEAQLVEGARRSTLDELTDWTLAADQVLVF